MNSYKVEIGEEDRQMIMMALADESFQNPGFGYFLGTIAEKFPGGRQMFEEFRKLRENVAPVATDQRSTPLINALTPEAKLRADLATSQWLAAAGRNKWEGYERDHILPLVKWASEIGFDLQKAVLARPGKNCTELFFGHLLDKLAAVSNELEQSLRAQINAVRLSSTQPRVWCCPLCDGGRSLPGVEGPVTCYGCNGQGEVTARKFVELLRKDVAPGDQARCVERAFDRRP